MNLFIVYFPLPSSFIMELCSLKLLLCHSFQSANDSFRRYLLSYAKVRKMEGRSDDKISYNKLIFIKFHETFRWSFFLVFLSIYDLGTEDDQRVHDFMGLFVDFVKFRMQLKPFYSFLDNKSRKSWGDSKELPTTLSEVVVFYFSLYEGSNWGKWKTTSQG